MIRDGGELAIDCGLATPPMKDSVSLRVSVESSSGQYRSCDAGQQSCSELGEINGVTGEVTSPKSGDPVCGMGAMVGAISGIGRKR